MTVSSENDAPASKNSHGVSITSRGSTAGLSCHVLVVRWVVGPAEVNLVETSLLHACGQCVETGVLILDNETVFHLY
jgi:hypothetical protein